MKKVLACALALSFILFTFPVSSVGAIADDSDDASFYLNYWVEEHTGINMKDIPVTAYGMSYADYIYRQTGYTIDYWVDNASNPSNFGDNTNEYLENTLYNDSELMKDLLSTTPITNSTSQVYGTNYNQRVNSDGDINVSGSDYWNSLYNGISKNGYNSQYQPSGNDGYSGSTSSGSFQVSYAGYLGDAPNYNWGNLISGTQNVYDNQPIANNYAGHVILNVSYNGNNGYFHSPDRWGWFGARNFSYSYSDYSVLVTCELYDQGTENGAGRWISMSVVFNDLINNGTSENVPILQDNQVGYVIKDGIKYPVYTDPSKNPFTVNPDGTVSFPNDENTYPIYIDPDELSSAGDQYMIQYIINNFYGNDNNDFDPFSGDPNNRLNYPDSNTKDYSQGINSVIAWLKKIYNKECDVVKYLKQIAKGLPLSDTNDDDNSDKFENFVSMLSLFNGKNNDGFKHRFLEKIAYSQIQANIDNFSTALFGSRTFNQDGTVNTSFGGISVTETPELLYTYQGTTHNFWTDLTLLNENGDLTKAKEYVRFFVIFAFFMNLFRSLPSIIKNGQFIASHAAIPDHESNFVDPDLQSPFEFTQYEDTLMWLDNSYDTVSFNIPDNDDVWFRGG